MPVGEVGEVEHLASPVLALDDEARPFRVDRDHLGGLSVEPLGTIVVAGELHPVPGAELLCDLGERLGDIGTPAGGLPVDGPGLGALPGPLVGQESYGPGRGVDGLDAVPDAGTRAPLLRLAEDDDVAGPVGGGEPSLGPGEVARFEHGRDHRILAQRAVGDEGGADGVGEFLPALAGRVEHQRPGALLAGEPGEVAGEEYSSDRSRPRVASRCPCVQSCPWSADRVTAAPMILPASMRSTRPAKRVRPPASSASIRSSVATASRVAKPIAPFAPPGTARVTMSPRCLARVMAVRMSA